MMKKLVSLALALLLVLSCLSGLCFAADPEVEYTVAGVTKQGTLAEANKAITGAKGGTLKLLKDFNFKDPDGDNTKGEFTFGIALSSGLADVVIDLNGHTVNSEGYGLWLGVYKQAGTGSASYVIKNGTIVAHKQAVSVCNGGLQMENVKAYAKVNQTVDFYDHTGAYNSFNVIKDCTLISGAWGPFCFQKGGATVPLTTATMTFVNTTLANVSAGTNCVVANANGNPTAIFGANMKLMSVVPQGAIVASKVNKSGEALTKSETLSSATVADKSYENMTTYTTPATSSVVVPEIGAAAPAAPATPATPATPAAPAAPVVPEGAVDLGFPTDVEFPLAATAIWYNETESKETTLSNAVKLANEKGGIVKMTSNFYSQDEKAAYAITSKTSFTLDLNGHVLKSVTRGVQQQAGATGTLTIVDTVGTGAIISKLLNVYVDNGALHLNGVKMFSETQQNIGLATTSAEFNDKNIIENCTIVNTAWGALAFNNAKASMKNVSVTIKNSNIGRISGKGVAVVFQKAAEGGNVVWGEGNKVYGIGYKAAVQAGIVSTGEKPAFSHTETLVVAGTTYPDVEVLTTKAPAEAPAKPTLPEIPAASTTPSTPSTPAAPSTPSTPAAPSTPAVPSTPSVPSAPAQSGSSGSGIVMDNGGASASANPIVIAIVIAGVAIAAAAVVIVVVLKKKK